MGLRFYIFAVMMIAIILIFVLWQTVSEDIDQRLFFLLYSIPSNLAISVFPHEPVLLFLGKTQSAFFLAVLGAIGTIIAGFIDYFVFVPLLAKKLPNSIKQSNWHKRALRWFNYQPFLAMSVAGFSPIPFFPFKFMAFSTAYPIQRYITAIVVGRFPRYYLLAQAGKMLQVPGWAVIGIVVLFFGFYTLKTLQFLKSNRPAHDLNYENIELNTDNDQTQ